MTDAVDAARECMLCRPEIADAFFSRVRLWEDEHWRLSAVLQGAIPGFAHLETRRHIPFITNLDGREAATLGPVLAQATRVLREAAGAELTYVYVSGNAPRICTNLAPHRDGGRAGGYGKPSGGLGAGTLAVEVRRLGPISRRTNRNGCHAQPGRTVVIGRPAPQQPCWCARWAP